MGVRPGAFPNMTRTCYPNSIAHVEDTSLQVLCSSWVISLERNVEDLRPETLGLKPNEAKAILAEIQTALVTAR